ncbi:MAG: IclR family transcriptional regulator [Deltaproteobacteria bacterium]|nr:IclR family transcriptional regulator [Deltaproteobacteria bacterium]
MNKKYLAPSVKKAFDILKVISISRGGIRLNEIAKSLDIAKSSVHGIISILEEIGAVKKDSATGKYGLGLTLFELGRKAYSQVNLREIARPIMEKLMESVQETVFLGTLSSDNERILVLDTVESSHDMKITSPIGTTLNLFAAAPGKAIMACMNEDTVMEIIKRKGLPKLTDKSITDPVIFMEEIRRVGKNGYAMDYEEYMPGVRAVAAPINLEDQPIAALYIVGFKKSLDDNKMDAIKYEIKNAAELIYRLSIERMHI